jgi:sulfur-oxidizing protein SoxZ
MRVRARNKGDVTDVRVLIRHDMETGRRNGERIVLLAQWGTAVSRNPYFVFKFRGGVTGDRVEVTWVDNKGNSGTGRTLIT